MPPVVCAYTYADICHGTSCWAQDVRHKLLGTSCEAQAEVGANLINMHSLHEEHQAFQGGVQDLGWSVGREGVIEVRR